MRGTVSREQARRSDDIRAHLDEVLKSRHFRASKRCQRFLTFLVENTVEGRHELLKERVIGTEVFNRPADFDPAADPVVRVTAAEVRKRLAQFYQDTPDRASDAPCFRIATGGYIPELYATDFREREELRSNHSPKIRKWLLWAAGSVAVILAVGCWYAWTLPDALERFWGPAFHSRHAPVILIEQLRNAALMERLNTELDQHPRTAKTDVLAGDIGATFGEATMLGNLFSIRDLDRVFDTRGLTPEMRIGGELYTSDLAERPVILIGYFNNAWAKELNASHLPFTVFSATSATGFVVGIRDNSQPGKTWAIASDRGWFTDTPVTYAVVTRLLQPPSTRFLLSVAGLTHFGTQAASDFITEASYLSELQRQAPVGWEHKNLQLVLETHIVNHTPTPPKIVASRVW